MNVILGELRRAGVEHETLEDVFSLAESISEACDFFRQPGESQLRVLDLAASLFDHVAAECIGDVAALNVAEGRSDAGGVGSLFRPSDLVSSDVKGRAENSGVDRDSNSYRNDDEDTRDDNDESGEAENEDDDDAEREEDEEDDDAEGELETVTTTARYGRPGHRRRRRETVEVS